MQNSTIPQPPKLGLQNNPVNNQSQSIQKDIIYFKEDVLKDIRHLDSKLKLKLDTNIEKIDQKLKSFDSKFDSMVQKIADLSKLISDDNTIREKVEQLSAFKATMESTIITHEVKQNMISKELKDAIFKYDKAILDNLLYPGIIGNSCRFKTFKDFIDYLLKQDSLFITFRDKQILDLKSYKGKLETLTKSLQSQIDAINLASTQYTNRAVSECEERIKSLLKIYDDRLEDMRVENGKYAIQLKTQSNNLASEWNKVMNIKNEILVQFEAKVQEMKQSNLALVKNYEGYRKEFKLIKNRFTQLSEFIKDVRFRINIGGHLKKREANKMGNLIDFDKKQILKEKEEEEDKKKPSINHPRGSMLVESFLKKYIRGEVDANTVMNQRDIRKSIGTTSLSGDKNSMNNTLRSSERVYQSSMNLNLRNSFLKNVGETNQLPSEKEIEGQSRGRAFVNNSVHISRKAFLDDGETFNSSILNNSNDPASKAMYNKKNYLRKESYQSHKEKKENIDDSNFSSSEENSVINEEENEKDLYSNPPTATQNIKENSNQPKNSYNTNINEDEDEKDSKNIINSDNNNNNISSQNIQSKSNEPNKKVEIMGVDKVQRKSLRKNKMNNDDIENTYTLPPVNQNKSFGAFPINNSKNENQTNINTVATSQNNVIIQKSMGKSTYNTFRKPNPQKKAINASKSQENIFSSNNNFKSRSNRSPDIVKKSTVNQLEEYIEQIKVYIPNTGLESDSNPYASDQTLKGKTIQMNNISIYNNYNNKAKQYQHQHNTIHKPKYASKNPYYYNANNYKEASINYYYNMMVNEDKNNTHYSSLSKVLTNQPRSLPNNKNNILISNKKQYYMRDSD